MAGSEVQVVQEARAYLNIRDSMVAWLAYRGELVTARRAHANSMSIWATGYMRRGQLDAPGFRGELALEAVRQAEFGDAVSRLEGFFVFPDERSARAALAHWHALPFEEEHLVELGIVAGSRTSSHDAEWITNRLGLDFDHAWMRAYWSGEPYSDQPIWETLVDGRALIYGTDVRQAAYEVVKEAWPASLPLLELSRLAPYLDSDLGLINAFVIEDGESQVRYALNFHDATDDAFLARLRDYVGPRNFNDLNATSELVLPDMRDREFVLRQP